MLNPSPIKKVKVRGQTHRHQTEKANYRLNLFKVKALRIECNFTKI